MPTNETPTNQTNAAQNAATPHWLQTRSEEQGTADAQSLFQQVYSYEPAGVWSAPGRVNLIGEHVDYADGISLPFALSQRTYVAAAKNDDGVYRVASRFGDPAEVVHFEIPVAEVGPGNPANWAGYAVGTIWAATEAGLMPAGGLDLAIESDVPVGAGLSSSAALECSAALAAFDLYGSAHLDDAARNGLMGASIRAENEVVGASTGGLDQRISLFGQAGHALAIDFAEDSATQVPFDIAARGLAILIMNTNAPHQLNDGQYAARRAVIDGVTADLGVSSLRFAEEAEDASVGWAKSNDMDPVVVAARVRHVVSEIERTAEAIRQVSAGDMEAFGRSMQGSHASLRDDYEVTVPELDTAVDVAMAEGALGARMTGGGFGGSAIALLREDQVEATAAAVAKAFAEKGFNEPEFVVALPSDGAHRNA